MLKPLNFFLQKRFIRIVKVTLVDLNYWGKDIHSFDEHSVKFSNFEKSLSVRQLCVSFMLNISLDEWNSWFKESNDKSIPVGCGYVINTDFKMEINGPEVNGEQKQIHFIAQISEERVEMMRTEGRQYKIMDSDVSRAHFLQMYGKTNAGEQAVGEIIRNPKTNEFTINVSLIDDNKIICSESDTYNLDSIIRK